MSWLQLIVGVSLVFSSGFLFGLIWGGTIRRNEIEDECTRLSELSEMQRPRARENGDRWN